MVGIIGSFFALCYLFAIASSKMTLKFSFISSFLLLGSIYTRNASETSLKTPVIVMFGKKRSTLTLLKFDLIEDYKVFNISSYLIAFFPSTYFY